MNIFFLHPDPLTAAEMHCDKHCVKMILETAQMLCTAHRALDGDEEGRQATCTRLPTSTTPLPSGSGDHCSSTSGPITCSSSSALSTPEV